MCEKPSTALSLERHNAAKLSQVSFEELKTYLCYLRFRQFDGALRKRVQLVLPFPIAELPNTL